MTAPADLIRAARETYHLELMLSDGLSPDALDKAIASALAAHERTVRLQVATEAESFAMGMEAEDDPTDYTVALRWFAHKLRDDIGPETQDYEPQDDDVVSVTLTGSVVTWESPAEHGEWEWSLYDDVTGDEYSFRKKPGRHPRVRLLSRSEE